jgi:hypothetical protein
VQAGPEVVVKLVKLRCRRPCHIAGEHIPEALSPLFSC